MLGDPTRIARVAVGLSIVLGAALLSLAGCDDSVEPAVYAVEGNVLVNGEPAANVNVAFHRIDSHKNAFCPVGRTNSRGEFQLTTHSGADGAPPGEYSVTLVWPEDSVEFDECECLDPTLHDRFKGQYASADQSEFRVQVGPEGNSFRFHAYRPRSDDPLR